MERSLLGKIVRSRRLDLNISQRELASRMQCDVKTISEIEKGIRKKPRIETLEKLSDELCIEIDDLLDYAGYDDEEVEFYYEGKEFDDEEYINDEEIKCDFKANFEIVISGTVDVLSDNNENINQKIFEILADQGCILYDAAKENKQINLDENFKLAFEISDVDVYE